MTSAKVPEEASGRGWSPRRHVAGFRVGIVCLDSHYELLPGNMQHADTYTFSPLYGIVRDVDPSMLLAGDRTLAPRVVRACQELVDQGVNAVVGACGSFANYQHDVARALPVPVCMSILVQLPFLLATLPPSQRLLVYFASRSSATDRLFEICGVSQSDRQRLVIEDAWQLPAFSAYLGRPSRLDRDALGNQVVQDVARCVAEHRDIGGVVLQCSDLPPYAQRIQRATGLPVYDGSLIAEWFALAVRRSAYPAD